MTGADLFQLESSAVLSDCGRYRYQLVRQLRLEGRRTCAFVMLNPSTADATQDDATIRRCMRFARDWGFDRLIVVNLFAWRATDPGQLKLTGDPVGPDNDLWLRRQAADAHLIVCAWGNPGDLHKRAARVFENVLAGVPLHALQINADGSPRHPLYVRAAARPTIWRGA